MKRPEWLDEWLKDVADCKGYDMSFQQSVEFGTYIRSLEAERNEWSEACQHARDRIVGVSAQLLHVRAERDSLRKQLEGPERAACPEIPSSDVTCLDAAEMLTEQVLVAQLTKDDYRAYQPEFGREFSRAISLLLGMQRQALKAEYDSLRKQRDELLEEMGNILALSVPMGYEGGDIGIARLVQAAIAKYGETK